MKINEKYIKISGKFPIPDDLTYDQSVELQVNGQIVKIDGGSNQDGTINKTYILKPVDIFVKKG